MHHTRFNMLLGLFWIFLSVLVTGLTSLVLGQDAPRLSGTLTEIRVEGSPQNEQLIKTYIRSRPGANVEGINLESERNLVYTLGLFSQVTVDLQSQPTGFVLLVRVRENPRIAEVRVEGSSVPEETWLQRLSLSERIEPEVVFNSTSAERGRSQIQEAYRQEAAFPLDVPVVLSVIPQTPENVAAIEAAERAEAEAAEEGEEAEETTSAELPESTTDLTTVPEGTPVIVSYTITENVPLREIVFEGSTVLEESLLNNFFDTLKQKKEFGLREYQTALQDVAAAYNEQGYRGSGVDVATTTLIDGVLTVKMRELEILSFDTTAIGVDPSEFSLKVGDLYNYNVLLEDIRRVSAGRDTDIVLEPLELASGIRVSFRSGAPASAGAISKITIEGNTAIPTEELLPLLKLKEGDNFTSALANEDFSEINRLYVERGYRIRTDNPAKFNYLTDGTYIIRIEEYKIAGYRVVFDKEKPKTKEHVITRYLPKPGRLYNEREIGNSLNTVARLGGVVPTGLRPLPNEEDPTKSVIVEVSVREQPTAQIEPALSYTTSAETGNEFVGTLTFSDSNFLGEAHNLSVEGNAQTSDLGFTVGGSVSYSIPWIYNNSAYYREKPTSFSVSLFSTVSDDLRLSANGASSVCYNPETGAIFEGCVEEQDVSVGEYTTRDNGVSFRIGRQVAPNTNLAFSAGSTYTIYKLEPGTDCAYNPDGTLVESCDLPYNTALEYLPQSGLSTSLGMDLTFDNRDNPNFPREGVNANVSVELGLGTDYRDPETDQQRAYAYVPLEFGVRTYLQLEDMIPAVNNPNHVFAFKVNAGHQFGGSYPTNNYFSVGDTQINDKTIRGFNADDTNLSRTYGIGTVEYRYDFSFDSFATETIIALVYTDVAWISSMPDFEDYNTPIIAGAGLGVQLNLNIAGIGLPAIRLDYSFSERNPTGIFRFRFGSVF
ncbi:MAG: BamA/OMP85 family outer membrane protein [Trueperaceae bacterium]